MVNLSQERQRVGLPETSVKGSYEGPVNVLPPTQPTPATNPHVVDALYSIKTTPYECSFLSRLSGVMQAETLGVIAVDWETVSPWMNLVNDLRAHYRIAQYVSIICFPCIGLILDYQPRARTTS